jgi:hypothetical protein
MKAYHVTGQPYESAIETIRRAYRVADKMSEDTGAAHAVYQRGSGVFENDIVCIIQPIEDTNAYEGDS